MWEIVTNVTVQLSHTNAPVPTYRYQRDFGLTQMWNFLVGFFHMIGAIQISKQFASLSVFITSCWFSALRLGLCLINFLLVQVPSPLLWERGWYLQSLTLQGWHPFGHSQHSDTVWKWHREGRSPFRITSFHLKEGSSRGASLPTPVQHHSGRHSPVWVVSKVSGEARGAGWKVGFRGRPGVSRD